MQSSPTRWRSLVFLVALLTAVVVGTSACQSTSAAVDAELARDLGLVDPAEVGMSAGRLERLDAGMQAMVDEGKLAGIVTMLARHVKVVFTDAVGKLDVNLLKGLGCYSAVTSVLRRRVFHRADEA